MNRTKIEWVKNPDGTQGYTWNPITGCLNGCPYCYARKLANGRLRRRYLANPVLPLHALPYSTKRDDPFYPRFWPERILPLHTPRKADSPKKGIFVCDMGELFGDWIPQSWQEQVFNAIKANPDYRFYLLTKQPQNLAKFSPFPNNCFVGVTVTADGDISRAYYGLSQAEAKVKYISCEPLLGAISMGSHRILEVVNWVILGAQTRPYRPPKIEWVEEIVGAADKAGIPVFLKDNLLELLPIKPPFFVDPGPRQTAHYRQEMPR